jgi:hypothetical protein
MIANKIYDVPDEQCDGCPQLWEGECRAFCTAHSKAEEEQRRSGQRNRCCVAQEPRMKLLNCYATLIGRRLEERVVDPESGEVVGEVGDIVDHTLAQRLTMLPAIYIEVSEHVT